METLKLEFDSYIFDPESGELHKGEVCQVLTPKDSAVLAFLLDRQGTLIKKEEILASVWADTVVGDDVVKSCIKRIRKALRDDFNDPTYIETIKRRGYRFLCQVKRVVHASSDHHQTSERQERYEAYIDNGNAELPLVQNQVARSRQLRTLLNGYDVAMQGTCRAFIVRGVAGIGKTFLVNLFTSAVAGDSDVIIAKGHCLKNVEMVEQYYPILTALQQINQHFGNSEFKTILLQYAPMWLLHFPWLLTYDERKNIEIALQGVGESRKIRELIALLTSITQQTPIILILEDLHWADILSAEFFSSFVEHMAYSRILLIGTYRSEERVFSKVPGILAESVAKSQCEEIHLAPFSQQEILEYLSLQRISESKIEALAKWFYMNTEGLPLFIDNLYRYMELNGWLSQLDNFLEKINDRAGISRIVPDNLNVLIESQINQLGEREKAYLEAASICGMQFNTRYLETVCRGSVEGEGSRYLDSLSQCYGFLGHLGSTTHSDGIEGENYSFIHSWFQKIAYERINPVKRKGLHNAIGTRIETIHKDDVEEIVPTLAFHFEKGGNIQKAVQYRKLAGIKAFQRFSFSGTIEHLSKALTLLERMPEKSTLPAYELEMLIPLGASLVTTSGYSHPNVEKNYRRAHELCLEAEATPHLFPVLFGLCMYHLVKGEFELENQLRNHFMKFADSDVQYLMWGYTLHSMVTWYRGEFLDSCKYADLAVCDYDPGLQRKDLQLFGMDGGICCTMHNAIAQWMLGYPEKAKREMGRSLELSATYGNPYMQSWNLCFAGWLSFFLHDISDVKRYAESSLQIAAQSKIDYWVIQATILKGWSEVQQDTQSDAAGQMEQMIEIHRKSGARLVRGMFLYQLADCHEKNNDFQSALKCLDAAIDGINRTGENWCRSELLRKKGELLVKFHKGNLPEAELVLQEASKLFTDAITVARTQSAKIFELRAVISLYRLWDCSEIGENIKNDLRELYAWFTEGHETYDLQQAKAILEA